MTRPLRRTAADFMRRDLVTVDHGRSIVEAMAEMNREQVSAILVTEASRPVGIVTERDLLVKLDLASGRDMRAVPAAELMSRDLVTVAYDEPYGSVIRLMRRRRIRHLPVTRDGSIIGMVSLRDLLNNWATSLEELLTESVNTLSSAIEKRDPYTAGHQRRVAAIADPVAAELGMSEDKRRGLALAATVHDIGKVHVPVEILSRPGALSGAELSLVREHAAAGHEILGRIRFPWPIARVVHQHHERCDGTGYPQGLKGNRILPEAKIIAVADVAEAIASHRPYRPARGAGEAIAELERGRGVAYDVEVVDACLKVLRRAPRLLSAG